MSRSAKKIGRGEPLVLPGMVCYAEKHRKPFWSSSLGQMVQFDTIIFGRTFKNYFGQFVYIEKKSHYNSRVSLHEAPTKTLQFLLRIGVIFTWKELQPKIGDTERGSNWRGGHKNFNEKVFKCLQVLPTCFWNLELIIKHACSHLVYENSAFGCQANFVGQIIRNFEKILVEH